MFLPTRLRSNSRSSTSQPPSPSPCARFAPALLALLALGSCGTGEGSSLVGSPQPFSPGGKSIHADGTTWYSDTHYGGEASRLYVKSMAWGRLVHIRDSEGELCHRDYLIGEHIQGDGAHYQLGTNPVTELTTLTILHPRGSSAYASALAGLDSSLGAVLPKSDKNSMPPFSFVPRNGTLSIRFSDLVDPTTLNASTLRVLVGVPASTPFEARILADPNFGGTRGAEFFPTRILIDTTVSELEAANSPLPLNSLGLPPSQTTFQPNVVLRIPTQLDFGSGQFQRLENPAGNGVSASDNGPVDFLSPSVDLVRAMRSGGSPVITGDTNNGFLLDLEPPVLVASQPLVLHSVVPAPSQGPGAYILDLTFSAAQCAVTLETGDVIQVVGALAEVLTTTAPPSLGAINDVHVRLLSGEATSFHAGGALLISPLREVTVANSPCYLTFSPQADQLPAAGVSTDCQVKVRFSEPMDPLSMSPFDSFLMQRAKTTFGLKSIVVANIQASTDLKTFSLQPSLPLKHVQGASETFYMALKGGLDGPSDLAGNSLEQSLFPVEFSIRSDEATVDTDGFVLRFDSTNEDNDFAFGQSLTEFKGQFLLDPGRGLIQARPVGRHSAIADPNGAVIGNMKLVPLGVQTPLSPLGSRMMGVYRYFDLGLSLTDPAAYNVDIEGINWSPLTGTVQADSFEEFEINLSHSKQMPDEFADKWGFPVAFESGLNPETFTENSLEDASKTVHPKELGYIIDPVNQFAGSTGIQLFPYPLNQSIPEQEYEYFTWRDTAVTRLGGKDSFGVPSAIEADVGLVGDTDFGGVAGPGNVPTIGLPLLFEVKCYPSDTGVGLNALDCRIATNSIALPVLRVFSTGGYNESGSPVVKNPDLETEPSGGFNANPQLLINIGAKTPKYDNVTYMGQLDLVVRVSRVVTHWFDADDAQPDYQAPVMQPRADLQPDGTEIVLAFRGASDIASHENPLVDPLLHADGLDIFGDEPASLIPQVYGPAWAKNASISFFQGDETWRSGIDALDGARYTQVRFTMISNTASGLTPELSAFGLPFELAVQ